MSEHTPGPWKANYRRVTPVNGRQDGSDDICHVYGDEDKERANAALIARAPELQSEVAQLTADNQRLRELLRECLPLMLRPFNPLTGETNNLLHDRIKAAIGDQ